MGVLDKYELRNEKSIIFFVDETHAVFMAKELRRLSSNADYAVPIIHVERKNHG